MNEPAAHDRLMVASDELKEWSELDQTPAVLEHIDKLIAEIVEARAEMP